MHRAPTPVCSKVAGQSGVGREGLPPAGRNSQDTASRTERPGRKKGVCISHPHGADSSDSTHSSGELSVQPHRARALPRVHAGTGEGAGASQQPFPEARGFSHSLQRN